MEINERMEGLNSTRDKPLRGVYRTTDYKHLCLAVVCAPNLPPLQLTGNAQWVVKGMSALVSVFLALAPCVPNAERYGSSTAAGACCSARTVEYTGAHGFMLTLWASSMIEPGENTVGGLEEEARAPS